MRHTPSRCARCRQVNPSITSSACECKSECDGRIAVVLLIARPFRKALATCRLLPSWCHLLSTSFSALGPYLSRRADAGLSLAHSRSTTRLGFSLSTTAAVQVAQSHGMRQWRCVVRPRPAITSFDESKPHLKRFAIQLAPRVIGMLAFIRQC